jgi:NAD(P)H-hydrate epimerase
MPEVFSKKELKNIYKPADKSSNEENGQVTIIGGSSLFHGAPLLSLMVASRIVDMVFFASPDGSVGRIAERIKSKLSSFIWVPWKDVDEYIKKSDAVCIGPGFMRYSSENNTHSKHNGDCDSACQKTRKITRRFLTKFATKKWVIDAGSLQTLDTNWIPNNSILTPNSNEYGLLFKRVKVEKIARKYNCIVVLKGPVTKICSPSECLEIRGGNAGMTKGGTGDVLAGLTVSLLAKNDPFLSACSASYIIKASADSLFKRVGTTYNADDLANMIPAVFAKLLRQST